MTSLQMRLLVGAALSLALVASAAPGAALASVADPLGMSAPSTSETTWTISPASGGEPDGRVSLRHEVEPGGSVTDEIAVTNFSPTPATFAVYASDGIISSDGSFDLLRPDEQPADGGSWITLAPVAGGVARTGGGVIITLEPQSSVAVPVTIDIPDNATPGDHPAGIVAELVPENDGAVQLASRVGVRAHLRVAGDIVPALAAESVTASWAPSWNPFAAGTVVVTYTIANEGNIRLGADTTVSVAGPFGVASAEATEKIREILPGDTRTEAVELDVWPVFFGWGQLSLSPVVVGEDDAPPAQSSATSFGVWTMPWAQLVLAILLVLVFLLIRMARRRSAGRVQARIDAAVAQAREQTESPTSPTESTTDRRANV